MNSPLLNSPLLVELCTGGINDVQLSAELLVDRIELVCHKAFDATPDLQLASQQLIDCGFNRILTSGGCVAAIDGCQKIRSLLDAYGRQIEYVIGGGVRARNLAAVVGESGCDQIHTAVRSVATDSSTNNNTALDFGNIRDGEISGYGAADRLQLHELMAVASRISAERRVTESWR
ncbi:MAG: copper homeostasis protein CutC [Planctomycetaceae bacterium]